MTTRKTRSRKRTAIASPKKKEASVASQKTSTEEKKAPAQPSVESMRIGPSLETATEAQILAKDFQRERVARIQYMQNVIQLTKALAQEQSNKAQIQEAFMINKISQLDKECLEILENYNLKPEDQIQKVDNQFVIIRKNDTISPE